MSGQSLMPVTGIDLDMTQNCCLRCTYCFKGEKHAKPLPFEVGTRAIDLLIAESGEETTLSVALFGGEPLMEFDTLRRIVCYGERKARYFGKRLNFGATTNSCLINDEILDFFARHRLRFHTSIDGGPASHDEHRVWPNGKGSSAVAFPNIKRILRYQPALTARWTLSNDRVEFLYEDTLYLVEEMGYTDVAMIPVPEQDWTPEQLEVLATELRKVSDYFIAACRKGLRVQLKHISDALRSVVSPKRRRYHCGAGRGTLAVTVDGDLYPCHRFSGIDKDGRWKLGNIWDGIDLGKRQELIDLDACRDTKADCANCIAVHMCGIPCIAVNWVVHEDIYRPAANACLFEQLFFKEGMRVHYILQSEQNPIFMKQYYPKENGKGGPRTTGQKVPEER